MIEGIALSSLFIFLAVCVITAAIHALSAGHFGLFLIGTAAGSGSLAFGIILAVTTALKVGGYT